MAKDFYETLGLQRNASKDDIKRAYRRLSKEYHPDRQKGDKKTEQRYKEINEAYETLSDPKKKQMYDQFGQTENQAGGFGGFGGFEGFSTGGGFEDLGDIFETFFGNSKRQRTRTRTQKNGEDLEVEISVELLSIIEEQQRTIRLKKYDPCDPCEGKGSEPGSKTVTCSTCGGTGHVIQQTQSFFGTIRQNSPCQTCFQTGSVPQKPCSSCKGEGRVHKEVSVQITVPAGIATGQTLRFRGKGHAGKQGASAGDLYVHVRVEPDARFRRDESDIRTKQHISVIDALLGSEISVETLHGPVTLRIPPGTQPEQIFRIKRKGLPILGSSQMGDHFVRIHIDIPKKLSRKEKKLLEEWKKAL